MIDFEPTEEQRLIESAVASFARGTLRERIREVEKKRALPDDLRAKLAELGLAGALVPEHVGGQALGLVTQALVEEQLAYGDPAVAFAMPGPGAFGLALVELGTEEQQKRHLEALVAGSESHGAIAWSEAKPNPERAGFSTVATKSGDGWILKGKKAYVGNAEHASRFVVFAQVEPEKGWDGIGAFVVTKGAGVNVGKRHTTLGLDAASFSDVSFDDVHVADGDRLLGGNDFSAAALRFFAKHALLVGARAVGLAQAAFDVARDYANTRKAFGKPIGHFQAVAFKLSDRLIDADSARWLVWRAAHAWDSKQSDAECLRRTAHAVATALEGAMRCADDAVQLHGGAGFMRDYPVEKMMRDAKQLAVSCMTTSTLDQLAALLSLGKKPDPATVLPTPETQPIFT